MTSKDSAQVAFISDVHSNIEALEAVLDEVGKMKVYCCGDIVGYGASPNEVVRVLRDIGAVCVLGNHDRASLSGDVGDFNPRAGMAAIWTSQHLNEESRAFLAALPRDVTTELWGKRVYMAHGSPDDPMWEYVLPSTHTDLFDYYLQKVRADVIALGHTHLAFQWRSDSGGLVFNPGSVGQPRTGDTRASFAILSVESGEVRLEARQVQYDIERAAKKILESGLPPSLATQLFSGE
ncbi:MAG TPA: metallophosphoesterase family protein [Nitrososphaerales archaeon]|nr:metallophosphoesterase family protein [Nitrososphaerales archaeon]